MTESPCTIDHIEVVGTGFTVMDRLYSGETRLEALGGSCGNVLLSLALLDRQVAPLLSLGFDDVGSRIVSEFAKAGAETRFIHRREDAASPVLVQHLDGNSGLHSFSFTCPDTQQSFPPYRPIDFDDLERARSIVSSCAIFYADRVSEAIVEAMLAARQAGAFVFFEPSDAEDAILFSRAVEIAHILKFSSDRLDRLHGCLLDEEAILIVTHGAAGLEVQHRNERHWCHPFAAPAIRDTCGSGDMVSIGLIDWLLELAVPRHSSINIEVILPGILAGQQLAAENCAFEGARGVFRQRGAAFARALLQKAAARRG